LISASVDVQLVLMYNKLKNLGGSVFMYTHADVFMSVCYSVAGKQFLVKFTFCRTIRFLVLPLRIWKEEEALH
jgi:hypothetical protein